MDNIKEITAEELRKKLLEKENILIVDIRTIEEYNEIHIDGAFFMELAHFNQEKLEEYCKSIENLKTVVFQCRSGVRSKTAMEMLQGFPYESYNLIGGIMSWAGLGYKVVVED